MSSRAPSHPRALAHLQLRALTPSRSHVCAPARPHSRAPAWCPPVCPHARRAVAPACPRARAPMRLCALLPSLARAPAAWWHHPRVTPLTPVPGARCRRVTMARTFRESPVDESLIARMLDSDAFDKVIACIDDGACLPLWLTCKAFTARRPAGTFTTSVIAVASRQTATAPNLRPSSTTSGTRVTKGLNSRSARLGRRNPRAPPAFNRRRRGWRRRGRGRGRGCCGGLGEKYYIALCDDRREADRLYHGVYLVHYAHLTVLRVVVHVLQIPKFLLWCW